MTTKTTDTIKMNSSHTFSRIMTLTLMVIATASFFTMAMAPATPLFAG
jgi:hypothetical protein